MRKRFFAAVLAVCLVVMLLPVHAHAAYAADSVIIAGKTLNSGMGWNNDGSVAQNGSMANNAYFKDGVLYLNDAQIRYNGTAISVAKGHTTLRLDGYNTIDSLENGASAIVFNAQGDGTAGDVTIDGSMWNTEEMGMLEINCASSAVEDVSPKGNIYIKKASLVVKSKGSGIHAEVNSFCVDESAMLMIEAAGSCINTTGALQITDYAAVDAESANGAKAVAITCGELTSRGLLTACGDMGAIACAGNASVAGGTLEAQVTNNAQTAAIYTANGKVSTNGLYTEAGISRLDAKEVKDFDTSYMGYRYAVVTTNKTWLDWQNSFEDVASNAWYYDTVCYVNKNRLMNGMNNLVFDPNGKATRAQAVQILYNMQKNYTEQFGLDNGTQTSFTDVHDDQWFFEAISWAGGNQIVDGLGNNKFGPDYFITREQFAKMLYSYCESLEYHIAVGGDITQFVDAGEVSQWAEHEVKWAIGAGILKGDNMKKLRPNAVMTRAEAATMLRNFVAFTLSEK